MIQIDHSLWSDSKTMILGSVLGISDTYAAAHLLRLWTWSIENTQDGNLIGLPDSVVAKAADWNNDSTSFVGALIKSRLLSNNRKLIFGGA